jgi:hypothetical protein
MSAVGQNEKNSVRAYVFRFALKLGHRSTHSACLKGANCGSRPEVSLAFHRASEPQPNLSSDFHSTMFSYYALRASPLRCANSAVAPLIANSG